MMWLQFCLYIPVTCPSLFDYEYGMLRYYIHKLDIKEILLILPPSLSMVILVEIFPDNVNTILFQDAQLFSMSMYDSV